VKGGSHASLSDRKLVSTHETLKFERGSLMATIPVRLTAHARDQLVARGFNKEDIVRIVNKPEEVFMEKHEGTYHCWGHAVDPYTKKERCLVIIYVNLNNSAKVITAMWTDRRGLQAHGFSNI
jgi:hypothetical protein